MKRERLYVSSIGEDCCAAAARFGTGIELAQYCTAARLDGAPADEWEIPVERCLASAKRFAFHGPFNELSPAAIDPMVLDVTKTRYRQAVARAQAMGIRTVVLHAGFQPLVYYPEWFIARSIEFWRAFAREIPEGMTVCLENVMEPRAQMLVDIVQAVDDARVRICLDAGHANTFVSHESPAAWLEACAPYVAHVHLHNNDADRDLHAPLMDGTIDVVSFVRQLDALCPAASCTLELARCEESLIWMEEQRLLED